MSGSFATPWTVTLQAPPSVGCHAPGDLPDPQIEPVSPALAGGVFTTDPLVGQSYLISLIKNTED